MSSRNSIGEVLSNNYAPSMMVFITTYKCTASCRECCFGCTPERPLDADSGRIIRLINAGAAEFPLLKLAVFTGGECFLLGKSLDKIVTHAKNKGWKTRCVTNGFWARTPDAAEKRLKELKNAGLTEINFSAGFAHQEFVPSDHVLNGAIAAGKLGMLALISVENAKAGDKGGEALAKHPLIRQFAKDYPERAGLIKIMDTVWVGNTPFGAGGRSNPKPCETILDTLVIAPNSSMKSCCGLPVNSMPEMDMGEVSPKTLRTRYLEQFDDFLKIWLKVDGPERIINYLKEKCCGMRVPEFTHPCQACKFLYSNPEMRELAREHFQEKVGDVLFRFSTSKEVTGRVNDLIGYGA